MRRTGPVALALPLALLAGCATTAPPTTTPSSPASVSEPAPQAKPAKRANVNLSGFPVPYQEGYATACDSRRRDEGRYKADMNYKMGWDDGQSICAARK